MFLQTYAVRRQAQEDELLQRFVRTNLQEMSDISERGSGRQDKRTPPKIQIQEPSVEKDRDKEKGDETATAEQSLGPNDAKRVSLELAAKKTKRKKKKVREQELYTDKDRAAAVNMGSRDIKHSLKLKKKLDRSKNLELPEEAEPGTFLALGKYEMVRGDLDIALGFINKALDLNPDEKHSLVARSQCYILLGQPKKALEDAEAALAIDKTFMKAIYQKAESLYYLGDFEHSLMYHYRGLRLRPEHNGFKLGVHKSQKAIENAIGTRNSSQPTLKPIASSSSAKVNSNSNTPNKASRATTATSKPKTVYKFACDKNKLLRELRVDKEYLDNLLVNPNLRCKSKDNDDKLKTYIQDAVDFLNARQEFWRQQLPLVQK